MSRAAQAAFPAPVGPGPAKTSVVELSIDSVFGPGGAMAQRFPGYVPRPAQVDGASAALDAFDGGRVTLAELPTGTGKSFAYLAAGVIAIERQPRPAKLVVVTGNIALQEQIVTKDLPALVEILAPLGVTFRFALAKGFSNYACKAKLDECDPTQIKLGKDDPTGDLDFAEKRHLKVVQEWAAKTETGDLSELEDEPSPRVKKLVTVPSDECEGRRCVHYDNCHPRKARKRFMEADVVVTNYHLWCIDLAVRYQGGQGVLPNHRFLALDEVHVMGDIAREYFGSKSNFFSVRAAVAELDAKGRRAEKLGLPREVAVELKGQVEVEATIFFRELAELRANKDRYRARLDRRGMVNGTGLEAKLNEAAKAYSAAAAQPDLQTQAIDFLRSRAQLCQKHADLIRCARGLENRDEWIYHLADMKGGKVELVGEPITAAKFLKDALWRTDDERSESGHEGPVGIFACSATLSIGGNSGFEWFAGKVGLSSDDYDDIATGSPFDYTRTAFVVPGRDVLRADVQARDDSFVRACSRMLVETVRLAKGRTLGLFTSYRALEAAHRELLASGLPYKVMRQGEAPRTRLIERFKGDESSVLLGTDSFWTGVDVPGQALSCLFIDKLPFPNFNDPVQDALKEQNPDGHFHGEYVPPAILKFKQGVGRLIRRASDYGVVVCCDRRILDKPYGKRFQRALPPAMDIVEDMGEVSALLEQFGG